MELPEVWIAVIAGQFAYDDIDTAVVAVAHVDELVDALPYLGAEVFAQQDEAAEERALLALGNLLRGTLQTELKVMSPELGPFCLDISREIKVMPTPAGLMGSLRLYLMSLWAWS